MFRKKSQAYISVFGILDFGTTTTSKILMVQNEQENKKKLQWEFPGGQVETSLSPKSSLRKKLKDLIGVEISFWDIKKRIHFTDCGNYTAEFYVVSAKEIIISELKAKGEMKVAVFSVEEIIDLVNRNEVSPNHCLAFARYRDEFV